MTNESGSTKLEYALLAALIAVVCCAGIANLGIALKQDFDIIGAHIESGITGVYRGDHRS